MPDEAQGTIRYVRHDVVEALSKLRGPSVAKRISTSAFTVGVILGTYVNGHGNECWPSQQKIGERAGMAPRQVRRAIHELEEAGFLKVVEQGGRKDEPKASNRYDLSPLMGDNESPIPRTDSPPYPGHIVPHTPDNESPPPRTHSPPKEPLEETKKKENQKPSSQKSLLPEIKAEFLERWNAMAEETGLAKARKNGKYLARLPSLLKDEFFAEHWQKALAMIPKIAFLVGENDRGWTATPAFFLRNGQKGLTAERILTGEFGNGQGGVKAEMDAAFMESLK